MSDRSYRRCSLVISLAALVYMPAYADLPPEDLLTVGSALHYKALCDAGLPGYQQRVAHDYSLWRISQAEVIARLESSAEFQKQQAAAQEFFAADQTQASADERRAHMQSLHNVCEVGLVTQFRTGEPVYQSDSARQPPPAQ